MHISDLLILSIRAFWAFLFNVDIVDGAPIRYATFTLGPSTTMHVTDIRDTTFTIVGFTTPPATSTTPYAYTTNLVEPRPAFQYINFSRHGDSYALGALVSAPVNHGNASSNNYLQSLYSFQLKEAFKCQLGIFNSELEYLPDTYVSFFIQNLAISVGSAVSNSLLMMQRNVFFNIGPSESHQCIAAAGLFGNPSIPFITPQSPAFQIDSGDSTYRSFYSTVPSFQQEARAMVNLFSVFEWNYVAIIAEYTLEGIGARRALIEQILLRGIVPICVSYVSTDSPTLAQAFANCVSQSKARIVVIWASISLASEVVNFIFINSTLSSTDNKYTFIASHQWAAMNRVETALFKGSYPFPLSFIYGTLGVHSFTGNTLQYDACVANINSTFEDSDEFRSMWEESFNCLLPPVPADIPICPGEINNRVYTCQCDGTENFDTLPRSPYINYMQDAVKVAYTGLNALFNTSECLSLNTSANCVSDTFTPYDLNQIIRQNHVTGFTGPLNFTFTQPTRHNAYFDIYQYREFGYPLPIGFANNSGPFLVNDLIRFNTYPDWPISEVPTQTSIFGQSFWSVLVGITASLGILAHFTFIYIMITNRWTKVVKKTNLVWFVIFSVSCIFIYLSNLFAVIPLNGGICSMILLFELLGMIFFSLCFVIKAQRFYRLLVSHRKFTDLLSLPEITLSSLIVLIPMITLVILIFALSGGMTVYFSITQSKFDSVEQTVCDYLYSDQNTLTTITYWISTALIGVSAFVFAFSSPLKTWYSERYLLFMTSLAAFIVMVILFPLQRQIREQSNYVFQIFLLRTLATNFIMLCTLVIVYFKKLSLIKKEIDLRDGKTSSATNNRRSLAPSITAETTTAPYGDDEDDMSDLSSISSQSSTSTSASETTLNSDSDDSILD